MRPAIAHTMLRVCDLDRALAFYVGVLGMDVVRSEDFPGGEFTLVFVGYDGPAGVAIELTHNWGPPKTYAHGDGFGHVAVVADDIDALCERARCAGFEVTRAPGPMTHRTPTRATAEYIAFARDADGYAVELVQRSRLDAAESP